MLIQYVVDDLSVVGFAARFSQAFQPLIIAGHDYYVNLILGRKTIVVEVAPFVVKTNSKDSTVVFMFSESSRYNYEDYIRGFIYVSLQHQMDAFVDSSIKDFEDYSIPVKTPEKPEDSDFDGAGDVLV